MHWVWVKLLVAGGAVECPLWEETRSCHHVQQRWPLLSWWHIYDKIFKGKNYAKQLWERTKENVTETTIEKEGEGSPGNRVKIPLQLQPAVKTVVMQIVPLQPVEDWGEAGIHIAACERSAWPELVEMTWRKLQPKDSSQKSEFLAERKEDHIGAGFLSEPVAL